MEIVSKLNDLASTQIVTDSTKLTPGIWECSGHLYLVFEAARVSQTIPIGNTILLCVMELTGRIGGPLDPNDFSPGAVYVQTLAEFCKTYSSGKWTFRRCPGRMITFSDPIK